MNKQKTNRNPISAADLLSELKSSLYLLEHYSRQITDEKKTIFGKPLSTELRKLYSSARGNHLLERVEEKFNIRLKLPLIEMLPNKYKQVSPKEYRDSLGFVSNGIPYRKIQVIDLVANQRGAHTDDQLNNLHYSSPFILLPWGNPAKTKLFLPQDLHCLLSISTITTQAITRQIKNILVK